MSQAYLGLTARVGNEPALITSYKGKKYQLEGELGKKFTLTSSEFIIDDSVEVEARDHNRKIASYRGSDEPNGIYYSDLIYDNEEGKWDFFYMKSSSVEGEPRHIFAFEDENTDEDEYYGEDQHEEGGADETQILQDLINALEEAKAHHESGQMSPEDSHQYSDFMDCLPDLIQGLSDPNVDGDSLPGVQRIKILVHGQKPGENGISSVAGVKVSFFPALMAAARVALPFVAKGLQMKGASDLLGGIMGGGDGGGDQQMAIGGPQQTYIPGQVQAHRDVLTDADADNFVVDIKTAGGGPQRRDEDTETMRAQVISALKAWADSGTVDDNAMWWVRFNYAHEADTISGLMSILQSVPADFHNAVLTNPIPPSGGPDTGLPPAPAPKGQGMKDTQPTQAPMIPGAVMSSVDSGIDGLGIKWSVDTNPPKIEQQNVETASGEDVSPEEDDPASEMLKSYSPAYRAEKGFEPGKQAAGPNLDFTNPSTYNPFAGKQDSPYNMDATAAKNQMDDMFSQQGAQTGPQAQQPGMGQVPSPMGAQMSDQINHGNELFEGLQGIPYFQQNPHMMQQVMNMAQQPVSNPGVGQTAQFGAGNPAIGPNAVPHPSQHPGPTGGQNHMYASYTDVNGNLLQRGEVYAMSSPQSRVPDYVRVVDNGQNLVLKIDNGQPGGTDLTLDESSLRSSKYAFKPLEDEDYMKLAGVSLSEQHALIREEGVARNLDRLNLNGTHYDEVTKDQIRAMVESGADEGLFDPFASTLTDEADDADLFF